MQTEGTMIQTQRIEPLPRLGVQEKAADWLSPNKNRNGPARNKITPRAKADQETSRETGLATQLGDDERYESFTCLEKSAPDARKPHRGDCEAESRALGLGPQLGRIVLKKQPRRKKVRT